MTQWQLGAGEFYFKNKHPLSVNLNDWKDESNVRAPKYGVTTSIRRQLRFIVQKKR